jgi:hypothetical protein
MNPLRIRQQLHRLAKSRLALSTVVTTLIIIVIAVLLAGVVTYFAINVTSTRVQEESLALAKQHVWFDYSTGKAQAAIMVINAGGRDVVVDKLTVRGQVCDWSKVFYNVTGESISGDLASSSTLTDGGTISVGGTSHIFKQATNDLTLQSGKTLIIYLNNPDSISVNDVGLTVSVNIFTSQAMYYKETNVQGTSGTTSTATQSSPIPDDPGTSNLVIQYAAAYYSASGTDQVALVINLPNSEHVQYGRDDLYINGAQVWEAGATHGLYDGGSVIANLNSSLPYYTGQKIQGYTLSLLGYNDFAIYTGYSCILYLTHDSIFESSDVGETIGVSLLCDDGSTNTKYITVQQA